MAFARAERAVRSNTADVFVGWDLVEKIRQHRRIPNTAGRHPDGPYLKCLFVDPYVYLAPKAAFRAAVLTRIPFAFTCGFDAATICQKMQRSG